MKQKFTEISAVQNIKQVLQTPRGQTYAFLSILFLVGVLAFLLGRVSVAPYHADQASAVAWCATAPHIVPLQESANTEIVDAQTQTSVRDVETAVFGGEYVASRSGSVYHLPWCSGAQRIAEENKRWFATKEEAEYAGYRPAKNCPGM